MSGFSWITSRRKYLVFVGFSTGAKFWCLLDYHHVQMSSVCWIINRQQMSRVLWIINSVSCLLDYEHSQMSSVCWIIQRRKCLFFLGLLNSRKCLDYQQAQMSGVC